MAPAWPLAPLLALFWLFPHDLLLAATSPSAYPCPLSVARQTRPNWAWIGEEVQAKQMSLRDIAAKTAEVVLARSQQVCIRL